MRTRSSGLAMVAVMALVIVGCGAPAASPAGASPTAEAPATEAPATDAPATDAPATEAPATDAPATDAPASPTVDLKIGVVTDVGRLEDASFNQFSNQGAVDAAQELGAEHQVIVTQEIADYRPNIDALINDGFNVIVTIGFLIGSDTALAAKDNPDVFFIGVDQGICVDEAGDPDPTFACAGDAATLIPNYQGIVFAEAESGYLAGIVAAHISESGVIGSVRGTDVPAVVAFNDGYANGARSVNPDIEVLSVEADPNPEIGFDNPARGREIANQMIDQGADVIFQIAGNTGRGALEVACDRDIYGIGVDVDQAQSLPDLARCIVTSAEKKLQATVRAVIISIAEGQFEAGTVQYNAASDPPAIGLAPFHDFEELITPEIQADIDEALEQMQQGQLDPRATPAP
jgi:basic membrane protein A and related proteins